MSSNNGIATCRGTNLDGRAAAKAAVAAAHKAGGRIGAFFCESILSCGGQVVLPSGYLQDVYNVMHEEDAVCVADEVRCVVIKIADSSEHQQQTVPQFQAYVGQEKCGVCQHNSRSHRAAANMSEKH